jgi:hypothetical protein
VGHRLLVPPGRRLESRIRLPLIQHPSEAIAHNLITTLMDRDSAMRQIKSTAGQRKATGYLPPVQAFTHEEIGGANSSANMVPGLRLSMGQNAGTGKAAGP